MELLTQCKQKFEALLFEIQIEKSLPRRVILAKAAIDLAVNGSTCYYSSEVIEQVFCDLAQTVQLVLQDTYSENSCLHVMTLCSESGGHTRVVERWIELAKTGHKQSLLFTLMENQPIPKRLRNAVEDKSGTVYFLKDKLSDLEKGAKLREIASQYARVVLHVHMYDVVPLIAFGTNQFKRPIIFFNHADHRFWVGASIADVVAELRLFGSELSKKYRGIHCNFVLSVPVDYKVQQNISKQQARAELGFPKNEKIILTIGEAIKYISIPGCDFLDSVYEILSQDNTARIIAIGPSYDVLPKWKAASKRFNNRLQVIGQMPKKDLLPYIAAADVVLDSRPMSGGLALIDSLSFGRPVLSVDNPVGQVDWVRQSVAYCDTVEEANKKALKVAESKQLQEQYVAQEQNVLKQHDSIKAWCERLDTMIASLPQTHATHSFQATASPYRQLDYYHLYQSFRLCFALGDKIKLYLVKSKGWKRLLLVAGEITAKIPYRRY